MIDFEPIGKVQMEVSENGLFFTSAVAVPEDHRNEMTAIRNYLEARTLYKLPLRIDMTVKLDSPAFYIMLGEGRISFGTMWSDNRRIADIAEPDYKINFFHNHIQMNAYADISVIYNLKEMQILVNGEQRYYSVKERYMKSKLFADKNSEGFKLRLACDKRTEVEFKSLSVTESETDLPISVQDITPDPIKTNIAIKGDQKPDFETCISLLPDDIRNKIIETDKFLRSYKPVKFKRMIEKHGNKITYVASDEGLSYALHPSGDVMTHTLQWYIITNGKPETWGRKADNMEKTLEKLAAEDPKFAAEIFSNLKECVGCYKNCLARSPYEHKGVRRYSCHGKIMFKMTCSDFDCVVRFIQAVR